MSRIINKVVIKRTRSLKDVEIILEVFLNCLIVIRDYINQILVFLNVF